MEQYVSMYSAGYTGQATVTQTADDAALCSTCIGKLKICKSFADSILYASAASSFVADGYDNCGLTDITTGELPSAYFYNTAKYQLDNDQDYKGRVQGSSGALQGGGDKHWGYYDKTTTPVTAARIKERAEWLFFDRYRPTYFDSTKFNIDYAATSDCFSSAGQALSNATLIFFSIAFSVFAM
jgi:hypothetical protein